MYNIAPSFLKDRAEKRSDSIKNRNTLGEVLGLSQFTEAEGNCRIVSDIDRGEYRLADLRLESEQGVEIPFFLMVPSSVRMERFSWGALPENMKTVIIPHGHGSDGRYGVCGIDRHPGMSEERARYRHDLGLQFVRRGYLVAAPDARGSGDRRLREGCDIETLRSSSCNDLNFALISLGTSLAGAWVRDLMALTDLLESRCLAGDLSVCGFSGGGMQALLLGAVDTRIKAAAVSGYFYKYEDCHLHSNLCGCNFIPGFNSRFDLGDVASLIAPRPLIIEKGREDPLNGRRGVEGPRELIKKVKAAYKESGSSGLLEYAEFEGCHRFDGASIFPFLEKHSKQTGNNGRKN